MENLTDKILIDLKSRQRDIEFKLTQLLAQKEVLIEVISELETLIFKDGDGRG